MDTWVWSENEHFIMDNNKTEAMTTPEEKGFLVDNKWQQLLQRQ